MEELTERIVELEIRHTHQHALIEELNAELTGANSRIDQLEKDVRFLREMLARLEPESTESPDE